MCQAVSHNLELGSMRVPISLSRKVPATPVLTEINARVRLVGEVAYLPLGNYCCLLHNFGLLPSHPFQNSLSIFLGEFQDQRYEHFGTLR